MHKVFISYHHRNDQYYKNKLIDLNLQNNIFIDKSVRDGDIPDYLEPQIIRQRIRDNWLKDSTVTILLVGTETRYRKHVDWELKSSMIDGSKNKRSGILVVTLPTIDPAFVEISFEGEKELIYPEYYDGLNIESKSEYSRICPAMPERIIDNLLKPDVRMSVVPWYKIENSPLNLSFLISETSNARLYNNYDLSLDMRMRDSSPTLLTGRRI